MFAHLCAHLFVRAFYRPFADLLARLPAFLPARFRPRAARALTRAGEDRLLRLAPDELTSLRIDTAGRVVVLRGRAWITVDGEPADHFLARDESLALRAGSVARISGDDADSTLLQVRGCTERSAWLREPPPVADAADRRSPARRVVMAGPGASLPQWAQTTRIGFRRVVGFARHIPRPNVALAPLVRARRERRMLELDASILLDIGAPEHMIEGARALRADERRAQGIARRLDFLR